MKKSNFLSKRRFLFWGIKRPKETSASSQVENILNYGNFDDVHYIIKMFGINKVSAIFHRQIKKKRNNYRPEIINYFKLYFKKNAHRNTF